MYHSVDVSLLVASGAVTTKLNSELCNREGPRDGYDIKPLGELLYSRLVIPVLNDNGKI